MSVIAKTTLRTYWTKHNGFEQLLKAWFKAAQEVYWKGIRDIKQEYSSVSFLSGNRVVFNMKGNQYRLIVRINFDYGIVWIRFIGTQSEYDKIEATKIQYKWNGR
ncbi:MAG: type II toxin-antitoxin system HigB family toxin [Chitinophagales bacterium]